MADALFILGVAFVAVGVSMLMDDWSWSLIVVGIGALVAAFGEAERETAARRVAE